jgi:hypothetical protein
VTLHEFKADVDGRCWHCGLLRDIHPRPETVGDRVREEFNSPRVLDIALSPPIVGIPAWVSRPHKVFKCEGCGEKGTLASNVGWVCDCEPPPALTETGEVEWS